MKMKYETSKELSTQPTYRNNVKNTTVAVMLFLGLLFILYSC